MRSSAATDQRFGGSNFAYQHFPFSRFLDDMVELGRSRVELWGIAPHLYVPELVRTGAGHIRRLLDQRGMSVDCFTPEQVMYPVNLASDERWLRELSFQTMYDAVEVASELEAPHMLITAGRGYENQPASDAWSRAADSIGRLADIAAANGVELLLEPLQAVESNLVNSVSDLERMLADVGRDNVSVVLDTVAMAAAGDTVEQYLAVFGDRLRHVHLVDGAPTGHLAWGDGELPLDDYVLALEAGGYSGQFTFELFGNYTGNPMAALVQCLGRAASSGI